MQIAINITLQLDSSNTELASAIIAHDGSNENRACFAGIITFSSGSSADGHAKIVCLCAADAYEEKR